jgi:hypothetical protein
MEFKQAIGLRRSIRYYQPYRRVERAKVQTILEAAAMITLVQASSEGATTLGAWTTLNTSYLGGR